MSERTPDMRDFEGPCRCVSYCADCDPDGPGICRGLLEAPRVPLIEVVLVHRDDARP